MWGASIYTQEQQPGGLLDWAVRGHSPANTNKAWLLCWASFFGVYVELLVPACSKMWGSSSNYQWGNFGSSPERISDGFRICCITIISKWNDVPTALAGFTRIQHSCTKRHGEAGKSRTIGERSRGSLLILIYPGPNIRIHPVAHSKFHVFILQYFAQRASLK